jgi:hypothetical protein
MFPLELSSAMNEDVRVHTGRPLEFFQQLNQPCPDFSLPEWQAYSLVRSIPKKLIPEDTATQDKACLVKFHACNKQCGEWEPRLNTSLDEELIGTVKAVLYDFFFPRGMPLLDSWDSIFLKGRLGPGASIDADGGDFYTKLFSSRLSSSSKFLVSHYEANVRRWAEWGNAENIRRTSLGPPRVVHGSRLSFVPKNDRISRSICTEPVLNMFYQLGIGSLIEGRLKSRFGIDLSTQPEINRELALRGSAGSSWCTIDLESASDTIALSLVRYLLPKEVVDYFETARSPSTSINGEQHQLYMVSTMGNGFTFPLQTAIFAAVVDAVYQSIELPFMRGNFVNFGEFGDDIIIDKRAWTRVLRVLHLLGFTVNTAKSFSEGPFRESCGGDYVNGHHIRGVYPERLDRPQDLYALINALNEFTARTGMLLPNMQSWLLRRVDRSMEIPPWEDSTGGIKMPLALVRTRRFYRRFQSLCYDRLEPRKTSIRIGPDYFYADPRGRRRIYNMSGLLISLLAGVALSSGLPFRLATDRVKWRRKRLSCSSWDRLNPDSTLKGGFDWRRWETAVYSNFIWVKPG